jgi:hypothetical protein
VHWKKVTYPSVESTALLVWFTLNVMSTFIAIYAIYKLGIIVKELKSNNSNLKFNIGTMMIHGGMLTIQLVSMMLFGVVTIAFSSNDTIVLLVNVILTGIDCVVQVLIAYICWSQGASEQLRKFKCILGKD